MRCLLPSLIWFLASAGPVGARIEQVRILPQDISETDSLHIEVRGKLPDGCWATLQNGYARLIETNVVLVDLYTKDNWSADAKCKPDSSEYKLLIRSEPLKAGVYLIVVSEHHASPRNPKPDIKVLETPIYAQGSIDLKSWGQIQGLYGIRYSSSRHVDHRSELRSKLKEPRRDHLQVDLNGDGRPDNVRFSWKTDAHAPWDSILVRVNDAEYRGIGDNVDGHVLVQDIDSTDAFKELAIPESGPSDDNATTYLYYDGTQIRFMGKVPGSVSEIQGDGSGRIVTQERGSVLQTWFHPSVFALDQSHKLVKIPQALYPMGTRCVVRKPFPLVASPDNPAVVYVTAPGDSIVIVASDDLRWCLVELPAGEWGWFEVDGTTILPEGLAAYQLMDGLSYAD